MTTVLDAIRVELAISREALLRECERVPDALIDARPAEDAWSIGEVMDHLAGVERRVGGLLAKSIEGRPSDPEPATIDAEKLIASVTDVMAVRGSQPLQSSMVPQRAVPRAQLLESLESSRAHLMRLIEAAEGVDLAAAKFPHPFFGDLDMYQWLVFIARHEDRHRSQIIRLREALQQSA